MLKRLRIFSRVILFERHIFSRQTNGQYHQSNPDISSPVPGGYDPGGGANQYVRLAAAIQLNRIAALNSASWGTGQIMGFNFAPAGFPNAEAMVTALMASEDQQLLFMTTFIAANGWGSFLANADWISFARSYNGPAYSQNSYDVKLASAHQKFSPALPDINVRAAQLYLTYLGNKPGSIGGMAAI